MYIVCEERLIWVICSTYDETEFSQPYFDVLQL